MKNIKRFITVILSLTLLSIVTECNREDMYKLANQKAEENEEQPVCNVPPFRNTLGGSSTDKAYSIEQTSDCGFIVAGYSNSNDVDVTGNHGGYDCWVIKLEPSGNF